MGPGIFHAAPGGCGLVLILRLPKLLQCGGNEFGETWGHRGKMVVMGWRSNAKYKQMEELHAGLVNQQETLAILKHQVRNYLPGWCPWAPLTDLCKDFRDRFRGIRNRKSHRNHHPVGYCMA